MRVDMSCLPRHLSANKSRKFTSCSRTVHLRARFPHNTEATGLTQKHRDVARDVFEDSIFEAKAKGLGASDLCGEE